MIPIARPDIGKEEIEQVKKVLKSGQLRSGPMVEKFEKDFARYCGTKYAVAVSNGTAALNAALIACGIKGEVITSSFSFIATSNCILFAKAKPVFIDINPKTFNITAESIKEKITDKTKAVVLVHLYGQPCDMGPIVDLCEEKGLALVEDAAQAHGAEYGNKKVGSFGNAGCFSFYPTKNMTTGEGGIITTDDDDLAKRARMFANHGENRRYYYVSLGNNLRMTEMEAAIGIVQLNGLDKRNETRIKNAEFLTKNFSGIKGVTVPYVSPKVKHVFHQYVIRSKKRDQLKKHLLQNGIQASVHYPMPINKQQMYAEMGYGDVPVPNAETAAKEVISLPVHPLLSSDDLEKIVEQVKSFSV